MASAEFKPRTETSRPRAETPPSTFEPEATRETGERLRQPLEKWQETSGRLRQPEPETRSGGYDTYHVKRSSGAAERFAEALRTAGPPLVDYSDYESLLNLAREPRPHQVSSLNPDEVTTPLVYVFGPITDSQVAINSQGDVIQNRTDVRPEQFYRAQFQPARRADPVQVVETLRVEVDRLGLDLHSQYVIRRAAAVIKVELARPPINEARVREAVEQILACLARQLGGAPLTARLSALAARLDAVLGNAAEGNSGSGGVR
ncbi:hypothetical protein ACFWA5_41115 [Streptomyces mirabilis]|uniref:hypothetical protein n=1 Tax=Streptomyces mirabilis TaxID=68239 RepID=UPI003652DDF6